MTLERRTFIKGSAAVAGSGSVPGSGTGWKLNRAMSLPPVRLLPAWVPVQLARYVTCAV